MTVGELKSMLDAYNDNMVVGVIDNDRVGDINHVDLKYVDCPDPMTGNKSKRFVLIYTVGWRKMSNYTTNKDG